jgi:hypothetical protein
VDRTLGDVARDVPGFEVWASGLLVKRERQAAPSFPVDRTDLAVVESYRQCLLDAAPRLKGRGTWDGRWGTLVDAVHRDGGCAGIGASAAARQLDLHVTGLLSQAREEDPPPASCEIDASQPCDPI